MIPGPEWGGREVPLVRSAIHSLFWTSEVLLGVVLLYWVYAFLTA